MKLISITPSPKPDKKLVAVFQTDTGRKKTTHFGQAGAPDYTITKDKEQRERYLTRHKARENWDDPVTPAALSRWVLWGSSTNLKTNIKKYKEYFGL
jgi:hypothetical protein